METGTVKFFNESKDILSGKVDKESRIKLDMFDHQFVFLNAEKVH